LSTRVVERPGLDALLAGLRDKMGAIEALAAGAGV
jgi:hypothetical protein